MIKILTEFTNQSTKSKLRDTLQAFSKNMKIKKVTINVYNKLLNSGFGKAYKTLSNWKNLPERKNPSVANIFERKLSQYILKKLRKPY